VAHAGIYNIIQHSEVFLDTARNRIVSFLSGPNVVNSLSKHPGRIIRVFPQQQAVEDMALGDPAAPEGELHVAESIQRAVTATVHWYGMVAAFEALAGRSGRVPAWAILGLKVAAMAAGWAFRSVRSLGFLRDAIKKETVAQHSIQAIYDQCFSPASQATVSIRDGPQDQRASGLRVAYTMDQWPSLQQTLTGPGGIFEAAEGLSVEGSLVAQLAKDLSTPGIQLKQLGATLVGNCKWRSLLLPHKCRKLFQINRAKEKVVEARVHQGLFYLDDDDVMQRIKHIFEYNPQR
jgi:hypothetical protein